MIFSLLNIEGLYLGVTRSCNLDVVHSSLTSSLLSNCGGLRTIYLSGVSKLFNDEFFCRLLQSQCLPSLENIHVKEDVRLPCHIRKGFNFISLKAQLSKKALGNLLLHCPQLRKVNLSAWNISREDFEKIMEKLYHDNLNITLIGPK